MSPEEEREGLDTGEHGMQAYTGFGSPTPRILEMSKAV